MDEQREEMLLDVMSFFKLFNNVLMLDSYVAINHADYSDDISKSKLNLFLIFHFCVAL